MPCAVQRSDGQEVPLYGGDFGDRPTDYQFCGNGIVYGNRTPSPKADEVKYWYQNLLLTPEPKEGKVRIQNTYLYKDTSDLIFRYQILEGGIPVWETAFEAAVNAQETAEVCVDIPKPEGAGELVHQVSAYLKEDKIWARAGFEIAFGEAAVSQAHADGTARADGTADADGTAGTGGTVHTGKPLRVIHGDVNLGIQGEGFSIMFSRQDGGIVSLRQGEKEWIARPPKPVYWRASTDNDRGNGFSERSSVWMGVTRFQSCTCRDVQIEETMAEDGQRQVTVTYTYHLNTIPKTITRVAYTVNGLGQIHVRMHFRGQKGLPELPVFGLRFRLFGLAESYRWYGRGPEETYSDRRKGSRLGIYTRSPKQSLAGYLVPQECGNHADSRFAEVLGEHGEVLRFDAVGSPFQFSVLPYTAEELEQAQHVWELPAPCCTNVVIAGAMRGVGGDDSWGAPVHPEYCISADHDIEYEFRLMLLKTE